MLAHFAFHAQMKRSSVLPQVPGGSGTRAASIMTVLIRVTTLASLFGAMLGISRIPSLRPTTGERTLSNGALGVSSGPRAVLASLDRRPQIATLRQRLVQPTELHRRRDFVDDALSPIHAELRSHVNSAYFLHRFT